MNIWVALNEEPLTLENVGARSWVGTPTWTLIQSATLLAGGDPKRIEAFEDSVRDGPPGIHSDYSSCNYHEIRAALERAEILGLLAFPETPTKVCQWAATTKQALPEPLAQAFLASIEKRHNAELRPVEEPNATPRLPHSAATGPAFPMKRLALIAQHGSKWPTIKGDLDGAHRNGLSAAKAGTREWHEAVALEWARSKGKLIGQEKPTDSMDKAMHRMSSLPSRQHKIDD